MKKIIVLLLVCFFTTLQAQKDLKWHTDISDAAKVALEEEKPMFLFFTGSDWCGWCIRLHKEVFATPEFKKWAENVVLVELDFPRRVTQSQELRLQNQKLQQMFNVRGYPTVWFVTPQKAEDNNDEVVLNEIGKTGYVKGGATAWIESADRILKSKK